MPKEYSVENLIHDKKECIKMYIKLIKDMTKNIEETLQEINELEGLDFVEIEN